MADDGLVCTRHIAVDADWASLAQLSIPSRLRIGAHLTRGLGAGGLQELGMRAAEDARDEIRHMLAGSQLVFVVAGLGGGTGTGAAPVVIRIAREAGAVAVAVATLPFGFEGKRRRRVAEEGLAMLLGSASTLALIPDDAALDLIDRQSTVLQAFRAIDEYVSLGVRSIAELFLIPGLLRVDWADASAILSRGGLARFGFGTAEGEARAALAAERTLSCPLLGDLIYGAAGLLINVTGGHDLGLVEVNEALDTVVRAAGPDPNLVYGCLVDEPMAGRVRVSLLATGLPAGAIPG